MSKPLEKYQLTIKESHLDTFGHVNNAVYLQLYEEARWEIIHQRGFTMKHIYASGTGPVILEVNLKFQKELRLREPISIQTEILEYSGKIGKLKQSILNSKGETCSEAIFTFALFDTKHRKIIDPTPEWKRALGLSDDQ